MAKLITEMNDNVTVLSEATEDGTSREYYIEGIFLQAEIVNNNGRKYPSDVLDEEIEKYKTEYIDKHRALGELGHPEGPTINLDRVSHKIVEMHKDGSNWYGKAKILDTPNGRIVKNLIDEGISVGVSSRALGSLKEKDGVQEVQDDLHVVTAADIVADPSAPDAFVEGIMEGVEWVFDEQSGLYRKTSPEEIKKRTKAKADKIARENKYDRQLKEQKFLKLMYEFLDDLSK